MPQIFGLGLDLKWSKQHFQVQPRTIFNYFFYRLLSANIQYLPTKVKLNKFPAAINFRLGLPRLPRRIPLLSVNNPPMDFDLERMFTTPEQLIMGKCALENANLFPWANGRAYLDAKFPKKEERQKLRTNIRSMVASVLDAFRVCEYPKNKLALLFLVDVVPIGLDERNNKNGSI
jgi:hypothetical protein